jgi:hypothetical protein
LTDEDDCTSGADTKGAKAESSWAVARIWAEIVAPLSLVDRRRLISAPDHLITLDTDLLRRCSL